MNPFPVAHWGGEEAAFAASPTFYAPLTNSLIPTTATGSATPTFSNSTSGQTSVTDWEGLLKITKAAEARFTGARRVENLVAGHSENFSNASWTKQGGGTGSAIAVATGNYATDPLGGSTASRVQLNRGADVGGYSQVFQSFTVPSAVRASRVTMWLKSNSGTPAVVLSAGGTGVVTPIRLVITLDSTWRRYDTGVLNTGNAATTLTIVLALYGSTYSPGNSTTADILAWGAQLEEVSGQSNQNPGEYVSVGVLSAPYHGAAVDGVKYFSTKNGNTVASNVVTEAVGAAITSAAGGSTLSTDATGPFGFASGSTYANNVIGGSIAASEDLSTFTLTNATTTVAASVASPAGYIGKNALIENTTNSTHQADLFFNKTASSVSFASVWVKAGTRTEYMLQFSDGVGLLRVKVQNLDTTATISSTSVTGSYTITSSGLIAYPNGWYRVWVYFTGSSVANHTWGNYPTVAGNATYAGVNGNVAVYLWGFMYLEAVGTGNYVREYVPAGTSRSGDDLSYSFASNAGATVGTAYAETKTLWSTSGPGATGTPLIAFSTGTNLPLYNNNEASTTIRIGDDVNTVQKTGVSDMSTAVRKCASSWTGTTLAVTSGGAAAASGTFDGNIGSTEIAIGVTTTYSANSWNGNIRNVKIFTAAATAAQLATMTT